MEQQDNKTAGQGEVQNIIATLSVTNLGDGSEPLMAARFTANGKLVQTPFVMVMGTDAGTVLSGLPEPLDRLRFAAALSSLAAQLTAETVNEATTAIKQYNEAQQKTQSVQAAKATLEAEAR